MIAEIAPPPSEAPASLLRWRLPRLWQRIAVYSTGLIAGTTIIGALVGAIGSTVKVSELKGLEAQRLLFVSLGVIALAYALHEGNIVRLPAPQISWQVPAHWRKYGKAVQLFLFGLVLGAEVFTFIPYAASYLLLIFEATLGVVGGAVLGLLYGIVRSASTLVGLLISRRHGDTIPIVSRILHARDFFHRLNGLTLATISLVLLGTVLWR